MDKVLILDTGGLQIYYGNPVEAVVHFKQATNQLNSQIGQCGECGNVNPELVFNIIETKVLNAIGQLTDERKYTPKQWSELYQKNKPYQKVIDVDEDINSTLHVPGRLRQLFIFIRRDVLSKISDKQYLLVNLLEGPILALILSLIIRDIDYASSEEYSFSKNDNIVAYIFMCVIVALFMGLIVSAEELYHDRKIQKRETLLNLSRISYLFSKIIILFAMSAFQTLAFVLIGNSIVEMNGMLLSYWLMLFTIACFANLVGLNLSQSFKSVATIYISIPIILIPQMILSGGIFDFDKLNPWIGSEDRVPIIAEAMASKWAYEGLMVNQYMNNEYERELYPYELYESIYAFKKMQIVPKLKDLINTSEALMPKAVHSVTKRKELQETLALLRAELRKERNAHKDIPFLCFYKWEAKKFDTQILNCTRNFLDSLYKFYSHKYNNISMQKEMVLNFLTKSTQRDSIFNAKKKRFYNENIADVVKRRNISDAMLVMDNQLIQKIDPIFMVPNKQEDMFFIRTQLYTPYRYIWGFYIPTFYFNVGVIWLMSAILFITLYHNVLQKLTKFIVFIARR